MNQTIAVPAKFRAVPSRPTQRLFSEQIADTPLSAEFVHPSFLTARFRAQPDPLLEALGGSRVEVAIGLDRTMYQLEVRMPSKQTEELTATWVKVETSSRRPKDGVEVPLASGKVPVTMDAAVTSLCDTFDLCKETVLKAGVNLLAFWEGTAADSRLELPMSKDWSRYSLAGMRG